jgi:TolA-binding protein
MQSGDTKNAIALLTRVRPGLPESNDRAEAAYLLGESYYKSNQFPQARAWYDTFLVEHRGHRLERDVRYARAWSLLQDKKPEEAASAFLELASGSDGVAHAAAFRAGLALKQAKKPAEAENIFRRVAATTSGEFSDDALYEIGVLRFEQGAHDSALVVFNKILRTYTTGDVRPRALFMIGEVHRVRGELEAALTSYRDARAQEGASPELLADIMYEEGLTLERLGRHDEAATLLRTFTSNYPDDSQSGDAWFWLGEASFHAGAYAQADSAYGIALQKFQGSRVADALYGKAWSRYRLNDFKGALELFSRLVTKYPRSTYAGDARLRMGDCYTSLRDYGKAVASYREVLKGGSTSTDADYARYQLGGALIRNGQTAQGIKEYETLIAGTPGSAYADDARYAIGWVHFQQRNYPRAIKEFRETLRLYPKSELVPRVLCSLGDAHYNSGDYPAAVTSYKEVLKSHPQSPSVLDAARGIRDAYTAQNNAAAGESLVAEYLNRNPATGVSDRLALQNADEKFAAEEYEAALQLYAALLKNHPQSALIPDATLGAAKSNLALGRNQEAERLLMSLTERYPDKPAASTAMLELGKLYVKQLRPIDALNLFERVETEFASSAEAGEARLERARTLRGEGDAATALQLLETMKAGTVSDVLADKARVEAAGIHLEKKRFDEATKIYTAVAQSRSDDIGAEAQCGVGEVLYARGDVESGIAGFLRVKYLYPGSRDWIGEATLRVADGYVLLGQKEKARELYSTVASEYKETDLGRTAATKLEGLK